MYFVQNKNYLNLITLYSALSDSYNKLVKLEKINKLPITKKPAILILVDKLFINSLINKNTSNNEEDDEEEDINLFGFYEEEGDTPILEKKNEQPNIQIRSKLFDNLNYNKKDDPDINNKQAVVFGVESGSIMK